MKALILIIALLGLVTASYEARYRHYKDLEKQREEAYEKKKRGFFHPKKPFVIQRDDFDLDEFEVLSEDKDLF